jgi:magnesium transporter
MTSVVEFDFAGHKSRSIAAKEAAAAVAGGRNCWIDIDLGDPGSARSLLEQLGIDAPAIDRALADDGATRIANYDRCMHVSLQVVALAEGRIRLTRLDLLLTADVFITLHKGPVPELDQVRTVYERDFQKYARSISFMLYEVYDRLAEGYQRATRAMEAAARDFQSEIFGHVDDRVFAKVSRASQDLLLLRSALLDARDSLHRLSTRRSSKVSETTQPFLESLLGMLDRLLEDLGIAREILTESLGMYMGVASYRTNRVITRLTIISAFFLPLSFLAAVYGMNVEHNSRLDWAFTFPFFWTLAAVTCAGLFLYMRRRHWL